MIFHIITLFPEMFTSFLGNGVIGRAIDKKIISVRLSNLRDFAVDIADLKRILLSESGPPSLTATDISLPSLENIFALFLS